MLDGRGSGEGRAISPLNEEREPGLAYGGVDADAAPGEEDPVRIDSRPWDDGLAQTIADGVDRVRSNGPAEQATWDRGGDPSPEGALTRDLCVDDRDELQIGIAERDDPIRRAPRRMTSALNGCEPVARPELGRPERQVTDRQDDVVDGKHGQFTVQPAAGSRERSFAA
jgi:hypothetical protein